MKDEDKKEPAFSVGETLVCLCSIERVDRNAHINIGDKVKVLQAYSFQHDGKTCQDITVQRGNDMPIAVLVHPGRFSRNNPRPPHVALVVSAGGGASSLGC